MVMRPSNGPGSQSVRINRYESVPGGFALLLSLYYRAPHVAGVKSECGGRPVMREDLALAPPASLLADRTQGHGWTNPLADLLRRCVTCATVGTRLMEADKATICAVWLVGSGRAHNGAAESKFC